MFRWPCTVINSYNKHALISQIYFVSDSSSVHHQEFCTVHTAMVYVIQVGWHIPLLCVQWKTPDDGQRNCPKHVEFYSKNKFVKLVHLVGFIIRITHSYLLWHTVTVTCSTHHITQRQHMCLKGNYVSPKQLKKIFYYKSSILLGNSFIQITLSAQANQNLTHSPRIQ